MRTNGKRTARKTRCLSAKAMTLFIHHSARLRRAIDEQTAPRHHSLARLQPCQYLDHAVVDTTGPDLSQSQVIVSLHHPDMSCIAFANDRFLRYSERLRLTAGDDAEARKH